MIEVTLGQIEDSIAALEKLAGNAKLPTTLYIKLANASRDVREQVESINNMRQAAFNAHTTIRSRQNGETVRENEFIDADHRLRFTDRICEIRATKVQLNRVKAPIAWNLIEEAKLEIRPIDLAALDWLIAVPADEA